MASYRWLSPGRWIVGVLCLFQFGVGGPLAQCLIKNSPLEQRQLLVEWVIATYAQEPQFKGLISVNMTKYREVEEKALNFLTLLLRECAPQMLEVFTTKGIQGVREEMNIYGTLIGQSLSSTLVQQKTDLILQRVLRSIIQGRGLLPSIGNLLGQ